MDHFSYRGGVLHAEDVPLPEIAAAVGTPVYVYSAATLTRHYRVFQEALAGMDHLICYAVKANSNLAVLALMGALGAGMDVVTRGRVPAGAGGGGAGGADRLLRGGQDPRRDAAGAGGRHPAVQRGERAGARGAERGGGRAGRVAPVAVRVNPDVDARTHAKIATGKAENKFGVPIGRARAVYAEAARLPGIEVVGIDVHIGSQLTELAPYEAAFAKVAELTGGAARRRACDPAAGPRRRAGHPLSADATRRRRCRSTMAR